MTRHEAIARILDHLRTAGPASSSQLSLTALADSAWSVPSHRAELLAELLVDGQIAFTRIGLGYGYRLLDGTDPGRQELPAAGSGSVGGS